MIRSKYFTLEELTRSDYAIRHEIDNTPDELVVENLQYLVDNPSLNHYGKILGAP